MFIYDTLNKQTIGKANGDDETEEVIEDYLRKITENMDFSNEDESEDEARDEYNQIYRDRYIDAYDFEYRGLRFTKVGNVKGGWNVKARLVSNVDYGLENFNHGDFYKVARKHHASVDLFHINGSGELYIPCHNGIKYIKVENEQIKKWYEYERWYK